MGPVHMAVTRIKCCPVEWTDPETWDTTYIASEGTVFELDDDGIRAVKPTKHHTRPPFSDVCEFVRYFERAR